MRFPWRRDPSLSLGWWRYEERERRLVQRASGAALAFEGEAGEAVAPPAGNPATQRWLRFRVTDAAGGYPLIVEARRLRRGEQSLERPSVVRLDHPRSGALWRSETGAAGPPPRPLWLRIDALAIDALSAWPYLADPELDWDWLAIEGGWMGDRWRPELYRSVQRLNRYWQPPVRIEPPAPATDPAPWRFVPARREMSVNEAQAAIARLRSLERSRIEEALHRLRQGQPHLAGAGAFALPVFRNGGDDGFKQAKELWLLADDEIVTDRLLCAREELPGGGHRWHWDFAPISPVGSLNRRSGGYARLPKSPVFTVNRDLAGQSFEPLDLPARCQAHLRALGEASFAWTMAAPVLLDTNGAKATPFELAPPLESRSKIYFAGDRNRWSWLTTRLSLKGPAEAAEPLAFAFRAPDAAADGPQRLGRFELDAGAPALNDAARGEALVLEESSGWGAGGPAEMRFRWSGSGGSWPMLVARAVDAHGREVLAIDQNASAARWAQENGRAAPPPQRLWRAAFEGGIDALLHWPDHPATGRIAPLLSRGGWVCGRWERDVAHLFELTRRRFGEASPDPQAEAEHGWTLLGTDGRGNEDSGLTAAAVAETYRGDFARLLADQPALRGVLRDDCRALMVHIRTEQRPYREDAILYTPVWLYADADVAVEVREETRRYRRLEPLAPPATLSSAGESLFERWGYDVRPTPRLWRRLFVACEAEAWLRRAEPTYPIRLLGGPLAGGAAELKVAIWRE